MDSITSAQNPRLKLIKRLRDKKGREREGRFVVDAVRDLQRALNAGYQLDFLLVNADQAPTLLEALPPGPRYAVPAALLDKISYRQNADGLVAVLHTRPAPTLDEVLSDAHHVLVLVALNKPGNIGALLRTADAAGFTAVVLADTALDLYNPNIIRSSTGAAFLGNIAHADGPTVREALRKGLYQCVAGHLDGERSLYTVDFTRRSAVILGQEETGLDTTWATFCDHLTHIPMHGQLTDSLNVSVSGALFMYEALRQREAR